MVQAEARHKSANNNKQWTEEGWWSTSRQQTNFSKLNKQTGINIEDNIVYTNTSVYNKSTTKHTSDSNKQDNIFTSTINNGQNTRLLDTRRTFVETSPHTTPQWALQSWTDTIWTWHYKAQAWQSNIYVSTRWHKDDKVWWSVDNTRQKNDRQDMDRIYKLWGRNNIQGTIHNRWWRYTTSSIASKRHQGTTTTYRTRAQRAQSDAFTIQIMVHNLRGEQGQSKQSPNTKDKQTSSHTMWLCVHQRHTWQTSHSSTYSNWRRDRNEHGNNGTRQAEAIHIPDTMPTNIPHWMWKNTSHFGTNSSTIRSRGIPRVTIEDNSENNWKQHFSQTITSIQFTITRKHWEIPQDTLQSSEDTHSTIEEQLQVEHNQH